MVFIFKLFNGSLTSSSKIFFTFDIDLGFRAMRNTIIITILLFVAVIGASIYYFSNLNGEKDGQVKPLTYLPEETFLISRVHNSATTDNIFKDYDIFEAIFGSKQIQQWQRVKDKLLRNSNIQPLADDLDMYISLHPAKDHIEAMFTVPTREKVNKEQVRSLMNNLGKAYEVDELDTLGHLLFNFRQSSSDSTLHTVYYKQSFYASYSKDLILQVLDDSQAKLSTKHIDYFAENNNRNAPLSVYFVHDQVEAISTHILRKKGGEFLSLFTGLGGHSAWNLNFKSDALILSGESETKGNRANYLEVFGRQSKMPQSLYQLFPDNSSSYLSFSISDRALFRHDLNKMFTQRKEIKKMEQLAKTFKDEKNISFDEDIAELFGNEFAVVEQSNQTELAFISLNDSAALHRNIAQFATQINDSLFRFEQADILYSIYGDPLKSYSRPYFIQVGHHIVLSNSQNVLQAYRQDWKRSNLLINSIGFKNFERIQGNEANITYFNRTRTSSRLISQLLKKPFSDAYKDVKNFGFQEFYSWSLQISGNNGSFISSIYGIYKSKTALGASPEWTYEFKHRPITEPWIFEHSDTSQFILMQEQDHTVHGIHPSGKKMWSAVFHGRIVGHSQQQEDRTITLVTDRNQLYRFNPEGKSLSGFPFTLPHEPSFSPTIATLNNEELLFIPADRHLLVYTMQGQRVESWQDITLEGKILFDIQVINDQVFVGTENGHFYQFNEEGKLVKEETIAGSVFKNPVTITKNDNQDVLLLAVDTSSNIFSFDFKKGAVKHKIADWNSKAIIDYGYLTSSNVANMVVLDNKSMSIYNLQDSLTIADYTFTQTVDNRPQYFKNAAGQYHLGIASRGNYLIYLFNESGALHEGFPIEAFPHFYYGKIDYNSSDFLLCVRRDKKLYAFKN